MVLYVIDLPGGRIRARMRDPLIKRHARVIDFTRGFFQLTQHPIIAHQWLTEKNPTVPRPLARYQETLPNAGFQSITDANHKILDFGSNELRPNNINSLAIVSK